MKLVVRVVAAGRHHFDDVTELVVGARVGGVDLVGLAARVVGQDGVDLLALRIDFDVLGPIHLGGAEQVGGAARFDQHVSLTGKAIRGRQRSLAMDKRQPFSTAVGIVLRDIKRAGVEQVAVRGAIGAVDLAVSHELVDVIEAFIVALINDITAVFIENAGRAFVLEAAHRGALLRRRRRIERIDLDHPAETVGLVRFLGDVEAVLKLAPRIAVAGHAIALEAGWLPGDRPCRLPQK